jgi:hypothetical protein
VQKLEEEELLEGETAPARLYVVQGGGVVERPERGLRPGQSEIATPPLRQHIAPPHLPQERLEILIDDRADLSVSESLGRRIDREDLARLGLRSPCGYPGSPIASGTVPRPTTPLVGCPREHRVLAGLELTPVVEPNGPRHEQEVILVDRAVKPRTSRPRALDKSRAVSDHRVKDPQPAAGLEYALGDHQPDDRAIIAGPKR